MTNTPTDVAPRESDHVRGNQRRAQSQLVFTVVGREELTPELIRIHLGGPDFDEFVTAASPDRLATTDKYVKLLFARPELGLRPPYNLDVLRETLDMDDMPVRRTYTVRSIDAAAKTLAIDFVIHGSDGVAGPWAATAKAGDLLALSGPGGAYSPSTESGVEYLLIGDTSALPAIASALESLPDDAAGRAFLEVGSELGEMPLVAPVGIAITWLHRSSSGNRGRPFGDALLEAIQELSPPTRQLDVFAHGEREAMKGIREVIQDKWGLDRRTLSLSAYWADGRAEDRFQAEKRQPIGQIFPD